LRRHHGRPDRAPTWCRGLNVGEGERAEAVVEGYGRSWEGFVELFGDHVAYVEHIQVEIVEQG